MRAPAPARRSVGRPDAGCLHPSWLFIFPLPLNLPRLLNRPVGVCLCHRQYIVEMGDAP